MHPTGTRVYVANSGDGTVKVIDTATNAVIATVPVGREPYALGQFIAPALPDQLDYLIAEIQSFNLKPNLTKTLDSKLLTAEQNLAKVCKNLAAFIGQVQDNSGDKLTADQADNLIADANRIKAVLTCP